MIKVWTLPVAPLWCDLEFFPNSSGNKAAANFHPKICFDERFAVKISGVSCQTCLIFDLSNPKMKIQQVKTQEKDK